MNNFYTYIVIQCEKNSLSLSLSLNFFFCVHLYTACLHHTKINNYILLVHRLVLVLPCLRGVPVPV